MFAPKIQDDSTLSNVIVSTFPNPTSPVVSLPVDATRSVCTIRQAEQDDSQDLYSLFNDPMVIYWTVALPYVSANDIYRQIVESNDGHYTLVADGAEGIMGTLGFTANSHPRLRHVAHIGSVAVSPKYQGRGIGKALVKAAVELADSWLNIQRLELLVYTDNEAAIALYRKFGFVEEGVMQDYGFRAGRYADVLMMARLRQF